MEDQLRHLRVIDAPGRAVQDPEPNPMSQPRVVNASSAAGPRGTVATILGRSAVLDEATSVQAAVAPVQIARTQQSIPSSGGGPVGSSKAELQRRVRSVLRRSLLGNGP